MYLANEVVGEVEGGWAAGNQAFFILID